MTPDEAKIMQQQRLRHAARIEFATHWPIVLERLPNPKIEKPDCELAAWLMFIRLKYPEIKT